MPTIPTYSGAVPYQSGLLAGQFEREQFESGIEQKNKDRTAQWARDANRINLEYYKIRQAKKAGRTDRQMYEEEQLRSDARDVARMDLEEEKLRALEERTKLDRDFEAQKEIQDQVNFDRQEERKEGELLFKQEENKLKKEIAVQEVLLKQQIKDERTAAGLGASQSEIEEAKLNNNLVGLISRKTQEKIKREGSTKIRTKNKEINKFIDENTVSGALDRWSPEEIKAARPGWSDVIDEQVGNIVSSIGDETAVETFDRQLQEKSKYKVDELLSGPKTTNSEGKVLVESPNGKERKYLSPEKAIIAVTKGARYV